MKQLVMTMEFNDEEVAVGADQYMLDFLKYYLRDTTNRTTVVLKDVP